MYPWGTHREENESHQSSSFQDTKCQTGWVLGRDFKTATSLPLDETTASGTEGLTQAKTSTSGSEIGGSDGVPGSLGRDKDVSPEEGPHHLQTQTSGSHRGWPSQLKEAKRETSGSGATGAARWEGGVTPR